MTYCLYCNNEILSKHAKKFCNNSCAAKHNNKGRIVSDVHKQKTSQAIKRLNEQQPERRIIASIRMKGYQISKPPRRPTFAVCPECNSEFDCLITGYRKICCSSVCAKARKIRNSKGIHPTEYNGTVFDSGWEASLAKWLDTNQIEWIRPNALEWKDGSKTRHYFPDFYLPKLDLYLDPKNPIVISRQQRKLKALNETYSSIYYGDLEYLKNVVNGALDRNRTCM